MKNLKQTIFCLLIGLVITAPAKASSLDDLYRDVIRSDNDGYLPLFVKNRTMPDVLVEEEVLKKVVETESNANQSKTKSINLTNDAQAKEAAKKAKQLKWQQTLQAVQENRVTPLELDEITYRVSIGDTKAIEVLAWMYTKGVGVKPDLVAAFRLYQQADKMQVPNAKGNAAKVYKAMTSEQKSQIKE